jgi:diadenylate cyclase
MFSDIINALVHFTIVDIIDILLLAFILYSLFLLIKDTRAYQMAIGIGIIGLLYLITQWGKLVASNWIIKIFINYLIIAIIVLFQGEIRRFLTSIGSRSFRRPLFLKSIQEKMEEVFLAVDYLSSKKIGALIAIEKDISLNSYTDRGTKVDADLSKDLLVNIFFPHSPLHDGAVIIQNNRISAACCLLPLPPTHNLDPEFLTRTRHLAAIGLSQETDAAVVVVSEETGTVSLATKGNLERELDKEGLKDRLLNYLRTR